jgi:hypothetical protein
MSSANQQRPAVLADFRVSRDRRALGQGQGEVRQDQRTDGWFAGKRNSLDGQQAGKHKHQRTSESLTVHD